MRKGMARVIVERPRTIDSFSRKGRTRPLEELPFGQSMRRAQQERGGFKMLNENLAPLRRYLERQVGQPWDKVYAEIAEGLRVTSTVQQHVRDHLKDFVAIRPRRGIRGRFTFPDREGLRDNLWHQLLYVDPRDGILKRTDRPPEEKARRRRNAEKKRRQPPVDCIMLAEDHELRLIQASGTRSGWHPSPRRSTGP